MFIEEFQRIGKMLWQSGLISWKAGNMSVRDTLADINGDCVVITRTGVPLGGLRDSDIIRCSLYTDNPAASMALPIHQEVYIHTKWNAVVHAHSPYTVARSLRINGVAGLEPIDLEGKILFPFIPVTSDVLQVACGISKIIVERGHGVFAFGDTLEECFSIISSVEHSMKILSLMEE